MSKITATYVDHMGNDKAIIDAARISFFDGTFETAPKTDKEILGLINYLARGVSANVWNDRLLMLEHGTGNSDEAAALLREIRKTPTHWTPFAHTAIKIVCSAPCPIRTQAFKHQTGIVANEESRRYVDSKPEYYVPEFRSRPIGSIKQGSGGKHHRSDYWVQRYKESCIEAIQLYEDMISDGISPEQARFALPQGTIVNWVWTGNLYAFANFVIARKDSHAQQEIQDLATQFDQIIRPLFPKAWAALIDQ